MNDKKIPHSLEAEQAVLGSMFLSKNAFQKAVERITSEIFYKDAHAKIFELLKTMSEENKAIDMTTLISELDSKGLLHQVGNVEYVGEILNSVPTAANIDEYINIIEDKAIRRRLIEEATSIIENSYDTKDSLEDTLNNAEKKIFGVVKTRQSTEFKSIQNVLFKTQSDLEKLSQQKGEITGLSTGFYDLDKITSGLHENELIIIAARPGMGKTAFALNIANNIAINAKKTVALFNMEMGAEQLATRMLSSVGQIEGYKMRNGRLENNDWKKLNEAISRLADTKMYIDDTPGMTIGEIRSKCRRLSTTETGLDIVIIDYLQLISGSAKYAGNRQQEVAEISRSLKTLAMELKIPIIALAQLSRSVEGREDKRPMLSDLRESGSIEQDADIVAFLYREDYYDKEKQIDENTGKSEFIISKHRNGPTATIDLIFKRNTSTFYNFDNKEE